MQMCIMWSCDYVMWSCDYVVGIITSLVMMNICECISLVLTTDDQQSQSLGLGTSRQFRATTFCIWGCIQPAVEIRGALRITSHGAESVAFTAAKVQADSRDGVCAYCWAADACHLLTIESSQNDCHFYL